MKDISTRYTEEDRGYESSCWIWKGNPDKDGYGRGGSTLAHREMYVQVYGPVPLGMHIHHLCEIRNCVNPEHLEAISARAHARAHSRLTMEDVRELRRVYCEIPIGSKGTARAEFGKRFGVSGAYVYNLLNGDSWVDEQAPR